MRSRDITKKLPMTSETIFPIASHSKSFTSTAIALLVDDGLLEWDVPIRIYYPKFKLNDQMASEKDYYFGIYYLTPQAYLTISLWL